MITPSPAPAETTRPEALDDLQVGPYTSARVLRVSAGVQVHEMRRDAHPQLALAKVYVADEALLEACVAHELQLLGAVDVEGLVRPLGLERAGEWLVLLHEPAPGVSVEQLSAGGGLSVERVLTIALGLTRIVVALHEQGLIHRDIKPSGVSVDADSGRVYLTEFGFTGLLERERGGLDDPAQVQAALAWVAPEQLSRARPGVDARSDLYSLGASFYQLLTGAPPFEDSSAAALVDAHLARTPRAPQGRVEGIPRVLAELIAKLLDKAPQRRYQRASGLLADLQRLVDARAGGVADPAFELGAQDRGAGLLPPAKLYDREAKARALALELGRVREHRDRRLVVVHGQAGVGKTALLESFEAVVASVGGSFGFGRYHPDPAGGLVGDAGLVEALSCVVTRLSNLPEPERASCRERLVAQVGSLLSLVTAFVPGLEPLVGPCSPTPALAPERAKHALELALSRVFMALEQLGTPVLVLDDLQWASARDVELVRALLFGDATSPLLIVVTCEDPALVADAPLAGLIAELDRAGRGPQLVALAPLRRATLGQLLAEQLGAHPNELAELELIVSERTGNIPGAIQLLLSELVRRGLLRRATGGWAWEGDVIARAQLSVDLASSLRASLDGPERPRAVQLLLRAACLGPRFGVDELASVSELEPASFAVGLRELEQRRLLIRVGHELCLASAQLRVVARELLELSERARVHRMSAAHLFAAHGHNTALDGRVFEIVDHHMQATRLLRGAGAERTGLDAGQRHELGVELGAAASARALMFGARELARGYLEFALEFAGAGDEAVALELALSQASVLAWCRRDADADAAFERLLARALPTGLRGHVVVGRIRALVSWGRSEEALAFGLAELARCGVEISAADVALSEAASLVRSRLATPADLDALRLAPALDDASVDAAMHIITALARPALIDDFDLFARLACVHVERISSHGFHRTAPVALAHFGLVLATRLGDAEHGGLVCDLALELCARVPDEPEQRLLVEAIASLRVWPLSRSLRGCTERADQLLREAIERGALELAGFIANAGVGLGFASTAELAELVQLMARGRRWCAQVEDQGAVDSRLRFDAWSHVFEALAGHGGAKPSWAGLAERERASPATIAGVWINQSVAQWLLGERAAASVSVGAFVDVFEGALGGSWALALGAVMVAIVACERVSVSQDGPDKDGRARAELARAGALARRFADQGWTNFDACGQLIDAEQARASGRVDQALAGYERARERGEAVDSACVQTLACVRMISLAHATRRRVLLGGATLTAIACARRWGARGVVAQLEHEHAELLTGLLPRAQLSSLPNQDAQLRPAPASAAVDGRAGVDADLLLGMLYLIGEDLDLDEVVARVLQSAIACSEADRGALLLDHEGQLRVAAWADQRAQLTRVDESPTPADAHEQLPLTLVEEATRTGATLVIDDASEDPRFASDPYVQLRSPRSLLCMPITGPGGQLGALLLEHSLVPGLFVPERLQTLRILVSQAGATLSHARILEALRRSKTLFQTVVSGAPDMISLLDQQGRIEFMNHVGGFPIDPATLVGMEAALMMGAAAPRWRAAVERAVETGARQELEVELELPDGSVRWYEVRIVVVEFGGGLSKLLSISTDITARKRAEAERLSLEAQLRQQQRLDSIGTLASGVAHEINNPIQGIMNYADLITGRAEDTALVQEFAQEIMLESDRVATIVRNLLAFSRQDADERPQSRSVEQLVATTLSLIRAVVSRDGIALTIDTPAELPPVRCRAQQIQQVIMNLVANARDAIRSLYPEAKLAPAGVNLISISACVIERDQRAYVRLSVEDHGGGVPERVRARIFDPFFTTKGRDQGTGLGLAVSHGIARDHGGELWFETEVGRGSVFHLELPAESTDSN